MTHDDDGRALDARMAAARPARDPDFDHPEVYAAARALIEELSMTTHVPDAPAPPLREPMATPPATRRARRALAGAAAAAAILGTAVALADGGGSDGDEPPGLSVNVRPAAAIRQDACRAATLWLDAGEPGTGPDDEAQAIAEAEAALAAAQSEAQAAADAAEAELETAQDELEAAVAEVQAAREAAEAAAAEQAATEREAELAAMAAELEALQTAVATQDAAAVESQVTDPDGLGC